MTSNVGSAMRPGRGSGGMEEKRAGELAGASRLGMPGMPGMPSPATGCGSVSVALSEDMPEPSISMLDATPSEVAHAERSGSRAPAPSDAGAGACTRAGAVLSMPRAAARAEPDPPRRGSRARERALGAARAPRASATVWLRESEGPALPWRSRSEAIDALEAVAAEAADAAAAAAAAAMTPPGPAWEVVSESERAARAGCGGWCSAETASSMLASTTPFASEQLLLRPRSALLCGEEKEGCTLIFWTPCDSRVARSRRCRNASTMASSSDSPASSNLLSSNSASTSTSAAEWPPLADRAAAGASDKPSQPLVGGDRWRCRC
mmetsp:Transcript_10207/g.32308  ORF Transcript_10207/g.32308 Transcript_10207/m.32308 type:complete len:322 (+) Transcript_10207:1692-2657(+)